MSLPNLTERCLRVKLNALLCTETSSSSVTTLLGQINSNPVLRFKVLHIPYIPVSLYQLAETPLSLGRGAINGVVVCKAHTVGFSLSVGVQELSDSNVIPNRMEAWNVLGKNILGKNSLPFVL